MDSLRHAADVIRRSPQMVRKKIEERRSRHDPLDDNWGNQRENLIDGITFYAKELGSRPAKLAQGTSCTDELVDDMVENAKKNKQLKSDGKLPRVAVTISARSLQVEDLDLHKVTQLVPIYRVSYCTADPNHPKVFAFIARTKGSSDLYCHAYLCNKQSVAEAMSVTVSEAFKVAFEMWEESARHRRENLEAAQDEEAKELYADMAAQNGEKPVNDGSAPGISISSADAKVQREDSLRAAGSDFNYITTKLHGRLESLDLAADDDYDFEFQKLAEARSNPQILSSGNRSDSFKGGDIREFLSVNNTLNDLQKSRSTEDLSTRR